VGQVASRSGPTVKALRHYDRISLLRPAHVDTANGYRLYRSDQVAEARLAGLLRSLDLPLDKVRTVVAAWKDGDSAAIDALIRQHRRQLDARVTRLRGSLHRIDHLLAEGLETTMSDLDTATVTVTSKSAPGTGSVTDERLLAAQLFNETWRLMEKEERTRQDDDRMIHAAHASRYHWGQVPDATPAHLARWPVRTRSPGTPTRPGSTPTGRWPRRRTSPRPGTASCSSPTWRPFPASPGTGEDRPVPVPPRLQFRGSEQLSDPRRLSRQSH
jgi:DNA-binding transcriptional MerR regulator